ncbi:T9SS type A sorting domain-containing protein [Tamlana sp. 2_MG-2023]|uniref:T9SS type A sorting domain-containing protein n=1 Tax=unclassified Tamlana TaxID=2614803 RepID=UPI0026E26909|nr:MULTISPECIES: T9SS type A sorting domain-containing protein [unclassified Tamlana]MDO6759991.1 T9SS type A sorting domain-containing protein [Tamlana sp. 2_MG-2023]MDO6791839.1 T9SS type A sorting domain-containing protein [Tamlana sp. 1_MG-2023]
MKIKLYLFFLAILSSVVMKAQSTITIVNPPQTVTAGTNVQIDFDYSLDGVSDAWAYIRFKVAGASDDLNNVSVKVSVSPGSNSVSLPIPSSALGTGYAFQAQLFTTDGNWSHLDTDNITGVVVEEGNAVENTITIVEPQTTVFADRIIDYNLSYTKKPEVAAAWALIRFKGPTGDLEQQFVNVTDDSGVVTVGVLSPAVAGTNYSLQAQLYTSNWGELDTYNFSNITVNEYIATGENTLEIVNTSEDPINNGSLRQVNVKYNLVERCKILVEVLDKANASNGKKIGDVWVELPAGNDTVTLDLIVDAGFPGTTNRIQALLFSPGSSWEPISIPEIPYVLVGKGDGAITYRGQPYEGNGSQNGFFSQDLGDGYYTNYYIANGWEGPLQMKFGDFGSPSWIDYENQNSESDGHKEFDIKIQKFSWHEHKDYFTDRGFPTALKDIDFPLPATLEGQWSPGSGGKGQINFTAWITEDGDMSGNRIDIIVHAFDNGGNFRKKYDDNSTSGIHKFNNIGEITANNGLTYQVLRTVPGYLGELASYNLVPDAIVQDNPQANYTTDLITSEIDMKDIIDHLIVKESEYPGVQITINENWQINGLEWTVVGQSENRDTDGKMIPSGHGRFTFNSYSIPNLVDEGLSIDEADSKIKNLVLFPNPCSDSFTYKFDAEMSDPVRVELYTLDGRKISETNDNSGIVNTAHLNKGMYLVRITSGQVKETRKLLKK